jgi:hypothetical protein
VKKRRVDHIEEAFGVKFTQPKKSNKLVKMEKRLETCERRLWNMEEKYKMLYRTMNDLRMRTNSNKSTTDDSEKYMGALDHAKTIKSYVTPDTNLSKRDMEAMQLPSCIIRDDGMGLTAPVPHSKNRINRCVRLVKKDFDGKPACSSKTLMSMQNETGDKYMSTDAIHVPLMIMELMPHLYQYSLVDAHIKWRRHVVCDKCKGDCSNQHFIKLGKYANIIENPDACIWQHCAICIGNNATESKDGMPLCRDCFAQCSDHGNNGGDNRFYSIKPVVYRFPWVKIESLDWNNFRKKGDNITSPDYLFEIKTPDMEMMEKKAYVAVEEDGNMHRGYDLDSEHTRTKKIFKRLRGRDARQDSTFVLFIRWVPKGSFKVDGINEKQDVPIAIRILMVRTWITWFVKLLVKRADMAPMHMVYMFYDFDNPHYVKTRNAFKDNVSAPLVGLTHTWAQKEKYRHGMEANIDWRFCLNPNEALIMQSFDRTGGKGLGSEKVPYPRMTVMDAFK